MDFAIAPPAAPSVITEGGGAPYTKFKTWSMDGRFPFSRITKRAPGGSWSDMTKAVELVGEIGTLANESRLGSVDGEGLFELERIGAVVFVEANDGWSGWTIQALADNEAAAVEAVEIFEALLPPERSYEAEDLVEFNLWMAHPMGGAMSRRSTLDLVPWTDVRPNYPGALATTLDELCGLTGPPEGGRLALFHGPPGTGKTRFLQTLASEWSPWCDMHYVMDPDMMFQDALYLNSFLSQVSSSRWSLLVLEDGDEFIDVGAKGKIGQGLSRLLNMADGFIGQATKTMVLISTNVEHDSFHPAAIRDGRCFAKLEFPAFPIDEATAWLDGGAGGTGSSLAALDGRTEVTLAELYAMRRQ